MATGFTPAYLLRGYIPTTGSTLVHHLEGIVRPATESGSHNLGNLGNIDETSLHPAALEMLEAFHAAHHQAQEALMLGQHFHRWSYNKGRLSSEFQEGDLVLLNPHSLSLLRNERGHGRKLLMKYDRPFEIIQKLSAVSYWLQMPESYRICPVLNIAHLEKHQPSPAKLGNRPTKSLNCADFDELLEYKVEMIIADQRKRGRKGRYVVEYLARFKGYNANSDEWLNSRQLRNAPKVLEVWHKKWKPPGPQSMWEVAFPFTRFYGILPTSPMSPPKIVPWFINASHHL